MYVTWLLAHSMYVLFEISLLIDKQVYQLSHEQAGLNLYFRWTINMSRYGQIWVALRMRRKVSVG